MTPEQRYLFDLHGYLLIPDAVEPDTLAAAATAAHAATAAGRESLSGKAWAWDVYSDPAIAALAFTPKAWPIVLELTNGQPMMRLGIGLHNAPHTGGGGMLHCNREFQRSSSVGSPSMATYTVQNGKSYCSDFNMFVYLDTVQPGDGGLLLLSGSHKAQFERPPSVGGTYGSGNWEAPLGIREKGWGPEPHSADNQLPPHTVNPCPHAGDIIIMSECTVHATMPWRGNGHRHVLRIAFKPQHIAHPEDNLTDDQIMSLSPEIRELRKFARVGVIKSIAQPGPVTLSQPNGEAVTDDERTHGPPGAARHVVGTNDEGSETIHQPFSIGAPGLPQVAGGMTDEQRYLFDIHGYCHLHSAIAGDELADCQRAAMDYINTPTEQLPEGFKQTPGGKFLHAHAWSPCLERLAMHPNVWPTVLELTDGKPKLLHESGTLFWEDSSRLPALGDSYDPTRDIYVSVAGRDGVHLHCGREGLFKSGLQFSPHDCGYFERVNGRLHCGNFAVFVCVFPTSLFPSPCSCPQR